MSNPTDALLNHMAGLLEDEESIRDFWGDYGEGDGTGVDYLNVSHFAQTTFGRLWPDMPKGFLEVLAADVDEKQIEEALDDAVKDEGGFCHDCWMDRRRLVESDGCQYTVDDEEHWLCEDCAPAPPPPRSAEEEANADNGCEKCGALDTEGNRHAYCDKREAWFCHKHVGSNACHECVSCAEAEREERDWEAEREERDRNFILRIQRLAADPRPPENIRQQLDLLMREWASYREEERARIKK